MIRERVHAGLARARKDGKKLGRPLLGTRRDTHKIGLEDQIRERLTAGSGIGKICRELRVGSSTVQRIRNAPQPLAPCARQGSTSVTESPPTSATRVRDPSRVWGGGRARTPLGVCNTM